MFELPHGWLGAYGLVSSGHCKHCLTDSFFGLPETKTSPKLPSRQVVYVGLTWFLLVSGYSCKLLGLTIICLGLCKPTVRKPMFHDKSYLLELKA